MPKGERAQERAERRRRRDPPAQQPPRPAGTQQLTVVDRVSAEHHREHERHHLAPGVRRARPIAPAAAPDARPAPRSRAWPRASRTSITPPIRDRPLIIELHLQTIQSDPLVIIPHHEGDLLSRRPRLLHSQPLKPCTGGHSLFQPRTEPTDRRGRLRQESPAHCSQPPQCRSRSRSAAPMQLRAGDFCFRRSACISRSASTHLSRADLAHFGARQPAARRRPTAEACLPRKGGASERAQRSTSARQEQVSITSGVLGPGCAEAHPWGRSGLLVRPRVSPGVVGRFSHGGS